MQNLEYDNNKDSRSGLPKKPQKDQVCNSGLNQNLIHEYDDDKKMAFGRLRPSKGQSLKLEIEKAKFVKKS